MQVLTAAVTQFSNLFPHMMQTYQERQQVVDASEEKFFTAYPQLKEHKEVVQNIARVYRQVNPKATYEQMAPDIAAMAMVQARVPIEPTPTSTPPSPPAPKPVTPTSARGGPGAAPQPAQKSEWDELIEED